MNEGNKRDHDVAPQGRKRNCSSALLGITGTVHLSQHPGLPHGVVLTRPERARQRWRDWAQVGPVEQLSEAQQCAVRPERQWRAHWGGHRRDQELSPSPLLPTATPLLAVRQS